MYRYVCPKCLRTFLEEGRYLDWFCFNCGQNVIPIGKEEMQEEKINDPRRDLIERCDT